MSGFPTLRWNYVMVREGRGERLAAIEKMLPAGVFAPVLYVVWLYSRKTGEWQRRRVRAEAMTRRPDVAEIQATRTVPPFAIAVASPEDSTR